MSARAPLAIAAVPLGLVFPSAAQADLAGFCPQDPGAGGVRDPGRGRGRRGNGDCLRSRHRYLVLNAAVPPALISWGYITGLSLNLKRRYGYRDRFRSVVSAGCPAPKGFFGALFSLARRTFRFVGGPALSSSLAWVCKVRR